MDSPQKPRLCISICEPTFAALEQSIALAAEACEIVEVRLDCLEPLELEAGASSINKTLSEWQGESILTFRPTEQGGRRQLDVETRQAFWSSAIFSDSLFDVEVDAAELFNSTESPSALPIDWSRTICSQHDFTGVPRNLDQVYDRLAATPARILKVA